MPLFWLFDREIENLQLSIGRVLEQKKASLDDFDNVTSQSIKEQIISNHEAELNGPYSRQLNAANELTISAAIRTGCKCGKHLSLCY